MSKEKEEYMRQKARAPTLLLAKEIHVNRNKRNLKTYGDMKHLRTLKRRKREYMIEKARGPTLLAKETHTNRGKRNLQYCCDRRQLRTLKRCFFL